jgi:hypothetical protein
MREIPTVETSFEGLRFHIKQSLMGEINIIEKMIEEELEKKINSEEFFNALVTLTERELDRVTNNIIYDVVKEFEAQIDLDIRNLLSAFEDDPEKMSKAIKALKELEL